MGKKSKGRRTIPWLPQTPAQTLVYPSLFILASRLFWELCTQSLSKARANRMMVVFPAKSGGSASAAWGVRGVGSVMRETDAGYFCAAPCSIQRLINSATGFESRFPLGGMRSSSLSGKVMRA